MIDWWQQFAAKWDWADPMLLLSLITVMVTALIPVFLWRLDSKQAKRQVQILEKQKQVLAKGRRDELLKVVYQSSDKAHLELLWEEVGEYEGKDQKLLKKTFRANPAVALPGSSLGASISDSLDKTALDDYILGLERRYSVNKDAYSPYSGLIDFIEFAILKGLEVKAPDISQLGTGQTAELQDPGPEFYQKLVHILPACASEILYRVKNIDRSTKGELRANVFTGVFRGIRERGLVSRSEKNGFCSHAEIESRRREVLKALASLLHRGNLRSFENGSGVSASSTVALLIWVVGWLADSDNHDAMRMVQNLPAAIASIPPEGRDWGCDDEYVRQGFKSIKDKQPDLWNWYGKRLKKAADVVGKWRSKALLGRVISRRNAASNTKSIDYFMK